MSREIRGTFLESVCRETQASDVRVQGEILELQACFSGTVRSAEGCILVPVVRKVNPLAHKDRLLGVMSSLQCPDKFSHFT